MTIECFCRVDPPHGNGFGCREPSNLFGVRNKERDVEALILHFRRHPSIEQVAHGHSDVDFLFGLANRTRQQRIGRSQIVLGNSTSRKNVHSGCEGHRHAALEKKDQGTATQHHRCRRACHRGRPPAISSVDRLPTGPNVHC